MKLALAIAMSIALLTDPSPPAFADKTTIDPNTVTRTAPVQVPDERLEQKVTYESLHQRLHSVLDDLSAQTGVTIRCGESKNDWQVRDLPIVVCARDLPLGKLLRAIADSTHLLMTSYVNDDGVRVYRIWRDKARKKQFEDYLAAVAAYPAKTEAANRVKLEWQWDTWARLGRVPNLEAAMKKSGTTRSESDCRGDAAFAKVMSTLGPQDKAKAFESGMIRVRMSSQRREIADVLLAACRRQWEARQQDQREVYQILLQEAPDAAAHIYPHGEPGVTPFPTTSPSSLDMVVRISAANSALSVSLEQEGLSSMALPVASYQADSAPAEWAERLLKDWPREPRTPDPPIAPETIQDGSYLESPMMLKELRIDKPTDKRTLVFADGLNLMSKAAGVSIVCEDFTSHRDRRGDLPDGVFSQTRLGPAILELHCFHAWHADEQTQLLVGSEPLWPQYHSQLVPESFLVELRKKLNGDGAELDDVIPMLCLTEGQRFDWIECSRDHIPQCNVWNGWLPLWEFYASLTPYQKELARSETGLKLSGFDSTATAQLFAAVRQALGERSQAAYIGQALKEDPALRARAEDEVRANYPEFAKGLCSQERADQIMAELAEKFPELAAPVIPTEMETILGLTLRVRRMDVAEAKQGETEKHRYDMILEGSGRLVRVFGPRVLFPMFSPEREAKLLEEKGKAAAKDTSKTTK